MPGIVTSFRDEREAKVPIPTTERDTIALADWLGSAAAEGYLIKAIVTLSGGDQRDPHTVGFKIVLERNNG